MTLKKWQQEYRDRIARLNNEDLFDEMLDAQIPDGWDGFSVKGLWKSNEAARQARDRYTSNAKLAALVTEELAELLEQLADGRLDGDKVIWEGDAQAAACALAARIREALGEGGNVKEA